MSLGQQTQANIHALIANTLGGAASAAGGGPVASALVSGLVNLLWPSPQQDVWDSIKADVEALIQQQLSTDVYNNVSDDLEGLKGVLGYYNTAVQVGDKTSIMSNYISARDFFTQRAPHFQQDGYQVLLLPLYVQMTNLYLSVLRDGVVYGPSWGRAAGDVQGDQAVMTQLISDSVSYVHTTFPQGNPAPQKDWGLRDENAVTYAGLTAYTRTMTLSVLDPCALWPYFDPSQHPVGTIPPPMTREVYTDSYWSLAPNQLGYNKAGAPIQPYGESETLLTHINSWGDTRPTGVQSGYADGLKPMCGKSEGADSPPPYQQYSMEIASNDPVVKVTFATQIASEGYYIPVFDKKVYFITRSGNQFVIGPSDSQIYLDQADKYVTIDGSDDYSGMLDEHVVSSVQMNYWEGDPCSPYGYACGVIGVGNVVVGFRRWDSYAGQQQDWRWCKKCQGLFFSLSANSYCRKGGKHISDGSGHYVLFLGGAPPESVPGWFWCSKCSGIFNSAGAAKVCGAGGAHDPGGSSNYAMLFPIAAPQADMPAARISPTQGDWSQCSKCSLLFFSANTATSWCPSDFGQHVVETADGHSEYVVKILPA